MLRVFKSGKKAALAVLVLLAGAGVAVFLMNSPLTMDETAPPEHESPETQPAVPGEPEPPPEEDAQEPDVIYPVGKLISSDVRSDYEEGQLRISIPRLDYEGDVLGGTDSATLNRGVGLFDYATLPSVTMANSNTSIAGHRDIYGKEFYYIDTILPGDLIYLKYEGTLFTYEVETNFVTNDQDWDPIRIKDYACVTLQSCTPINIATERIFVVGRLISTEEGKDFPEPQEEL